MCEKSHMLLLLLLFDDSVVFLDVSFVFLLFSW